MRCDLVHNRYTELNIQYYAALAAQSKGNPVVISTLGKRLRKHRICPAISTMASFMGYYKSGLAKKDASH